MQERALRWLHSNGLHRRALFIADRFYGDAPAYIVGDASIIERMAATWQPLSALLDLPEFDSPLTAHQYIEILKARSGANR